MDLSLPRAASRIPSHQLSKFTASIHLRLQKQITRVAESYLIMGAAVQSNIVPAHHLAKYQLNAPYVAISQHQLSGLGGANKCDKLTAPQISSY